MRRPEHGVPVDYASLVTNVVRSPHGVKSPRSGELQGARFALHYHDQHDLTSREADGGYKLRSGVVIEQ